MYYESGRKKNLIVWIIALIIIAVILNAPAVRKFPLLRITRTFANNVLYPFKYAGTAIFNKTTTGVFHFLAVKGIQKENEALKKEMEELKAKNMMLSQLDRENRILRDMISFRSRYVASRLLPAEVISRSGSNWFETIEINRGVSDGVVVDTALINPEGLVGRIVEVAQFSSKALLLTDPSSAVSIIDASTGDMGIINGNSIGPLSLRYMSANAAIKIGDKIITSGMSTIFPKNIVVGTVRSISKKDFDIFQKVEVTPAANFSRLENLFVVMK